MPTKIEEGSDSKTQAQVIVILENKQRTYLKKTKTCGPAGHQLRIQEVATIFRGEFGDIGKMAACEQELPITWQIVRFGDQKGESTASGQRMYGVGR